VLIMAKLPVDLPKDDAETEPKTSTSVEAAICRHVLSVLGRPTDFLRISVRQITAKGFRVNVLAGAELASGRIAHSYLVQTTDDGLVTASSPALVKRY